MTKHKMLDRVHVRNDKDREIYNEIDACLTTELTPYSKIDTEIAGLWKNARAWSMFFDKYKIEPLGIAFEDFIEDKMGTLEGVSLFLGNPISLSDGELEEEVQSVRTAVNEKWYADSMEYFTGLF